MKKIASLALVLCLAACAGGSWSKDGTTPQAAAADLADCNSLAQTATERDANIDTRIQREDDAAQSQTVRDDVVSRCMIAKGYAPGS